MRWRGRRESSNVEDRRGQSSGGLSRGGLKLPIGRGGGKPSLIMLVVIGGVLWMLGVSPSTIISMLMGGGGSIVPQTQSQQQTTPQQSAANDEMASFVKVVLAETEDVWGTIFQQAGQKYPEPNLVLFSNRVSSACGAASSATGPFYCPGDKKVYIDLGFYRELKTKFEAPGDFAQAYVVAHEVGHHIQNITGVLPKFNQMRRSMSKLEANQMSIRVELQADCYAGVWAHFTNQKGLLERGDLEEALNAATQIGDDALQKRTQGYVVPDSFNHGTSVQRKRWFTRGFESGKVSSCDTFQVANP
ncbi:KPN_02809 family neutral zinc metallopeptidase [Cohaesibacter celericrescens]|uniref:Flagellar biosynthesis protein FlgM n=1 Tax=Cohaesibacter celericrescens TaxID=2067669 RepID=A0A2N5XX73_9HYPH|nr:neutral zinc metallopeptidase [Cohaesibacter celericrescens]PLW79113.1 flagellar biosynthesis protein FlgM [Cohaesibacter celericrescens]